MGKNKQKHEIYKTKNINSIVLLDTDTKEVKCKINELKNDKSPGSDEIKSETLKYISDFFIKTTSVYIK